MTLETTKKAVTDAATQTMKVADTSIKKAWSILDAATEKQSPSEYLGQRAVKSIQGQC
jgi:hypothetical protein